jgi:hypothetical protein
VGIRQASPRHGIFLTKKGEIPRDLRKGEHPMYFAYLSQRKGGHANSMSPLIHSLHLPLLLSPGYIKLNRRFNRCCRFPKVCKKNRLFDRPDNAECIKTMRKEGREGGCTGYW